MKKTILMLAMVPLLFWAGTSCEEEGRGPLVPDGTPPGPVSNPQVTNIPGGAQITYDIPADDDLIYVEARYKRKGEPVVSRSSIYKDTLLIEGLSSTEPQEVELVAVDLGANESAPLKVMITPEKSPLTQMFESFQLVPDFGGARLNYKNPGEIKAELLLYTVEGDKKTYNQSAFLEGKEIYKFHTFRDEAFNNKSVKFALEAKDLWGNITETYENEVRALEEDLMDREKMRGVLLVGDSPSDYGWVLSNLIDGITKGNQGFHTNVQITAPIVPPYTESLAMFTIDMGVIARLSRIKWWQRDAGDYKWHYTRGNPRYFEIWGTDVLPDDSGASMATGWTRLVKDGEIIRPSGKVSGPVTPEEIVISERGFEFPISANPMRYIRFVCKENWGGSKFMNLTEIKMWGKVVREVGN